MEGGHRHGDESQKRGTHPGRSFPEWAMAISGPLGRLQPLLPDSLALPGPHPHALSPSLLHTRAHAVSPTHTYGVSHTYGALTQCLTHTCRLIQNTHGLTHTSTRPRHPTLRTQSHTEPLQMPRPQLLSSEDRWPQWLFWSMDAPACVCLDSVCAGATGDTEPGGGPCPQGRLEKRYLQRCSHSMGSLGSGGRRCLPCSQGHFQTLLPLRLGCHRVASLPSQVLPPPPAQVTPAAPSTHWPQDPSSPRLSPSRHCCAHVLDNALLGAGLPPASRADLTSYPSPAAQGPHTGPAVLPAILTTLHTQPGLKSST